MRPEGANHDVDDERVAAVVMTEAGNINSNNKMGVLMV